MSFFKRLAEAVTVKLIVEVIFVAIGLILGYLNRDMILNLLLYRLPTWVIIIVALLILLLVVIAVTPYSSRKEKGVSLAVVPSRPENPKYIFDVNMFGVKWKVLYGPYAFSEGPFCPKCMFEMDSEKKGLVRKSYYWKCIPCNKFYKIPEKSSYDAGRAVEKYLESEIRSGRLKLEGRK